MRDASIRYPVSGIQSPVSGRVALRVRRLCWEVYWRVAVKSFQKSLTYRAANLAGIATNMFFGVIYIFIYQALYAGRGEVAGFTLADTITYAIIAQSLLSAMSAFGNNGLSIAVVKGTIAVDLSRPVDFYLYWAAVDLGRAAYYVLFRGIPVYLLGALAFGVNLPPSLLHWLLFALAQLPIDVYLGKLSAAQTAAALAQQAAWLVVLVLLGRWTLARMVRRIALAGG